MDKGSRVTGKAGPGHKGEGPHLSHLLTPQLVPRPAGGQVSVCLLIRPTPQHLLTWG